LQPTTPLLSRTDRDRLRRFIALHEARLAREAAAFAALEESVETARIVDPDEVPRDVVTMYSQVRLRDLDSGRRFIISVTLPADAADGNGSFWRTYAAAALIGAREGEDIVWRCAGRLCRARVEQVLFQPEAAGGELPMQTRHEGPPTAAVDPGWIVGSKTMPS
jgi:regulator of nucleoside diphosphate kinase